MFEMFDSVFFYGVFIVRDQENAVGLFPDLSSQL